VAVTAVLPTLFAGRGKLGWLDLVMDPRFRASQARFPAVVNWLPDLGTLKPVTLMTLALVLACVATRRWSGVIVAAVAVPAATGLTEYVLKPSIGQAVWWGTSHSYPSGHATGMFALAAICAVLLLDPPGRRVPGVIRSLLVFIALVLAAAVAGAMVAIGAHAFTDAVGGAAVGTGVVMACALALDLVAEVLRGGRWAVPRFTVDRDDDVAAAGDDLARGDQEAAPEDAGSGKGAAARAATRRHREYDEVLRGVPVPARDQGKPNGQEPLVPFNERTQDDDNG
jgi:membrane-associated phospholipid phosphatase